MKPNIDLLIVRSKEIRENVELLKKVGELSREEFLSNRGILDASKYRLLTLIESAISICNHIASKLGGQAPESFADCFLSLSKNGIISDDLGNRLARRVLFC